MMARRIIVVRKKRRNKRGRSKESWTKGDAYCFSCTRVRNREQSLLYHGIHFYGGEIKEDICVSLPYFIFASGDIFRFVYSQLLLLSLSTVFRLSFHSFISLMPDFSYFFMFNLPFYTHHGVCASFVFIVVPCLISSPIPPTIPS